MKTEQSFNIFFEVIDNKLPLVMHYRNQLIKEHNIEHEPYMDEDAKLDLSMSSADQLCFERVELNFSCGSFDSEDVFYCFIPTKYLFLDNWKDIMKDDYKKIAFNEKKKKLEVEKALLQKKEDEKQQKLKEKEIKDKELYEKLKKQFEGDKNEE